MSQNIIELKDPFKKKKSAKPILAQINEDGCYLCINRPPKSDGRYYDIKRNGKVMLLHRYIYEVYKGEIPEGMIVRHTCDNDLCINPEHLIIGTILDNVHDAIERNRLKTDTQHPFAKLTEKDIYEIKHYYLKVYYHNGILQENIGLIKQQLVT